MCAPLFGGKTSAFQAMKKACRVGINHASRVVEFTRLQEMEESSQGVLFLGWMVVATVVMREEFAT
jgi:hypothetical protein